MKSLVLFMALVAAFAFPTHVYGQQEVDPDHFDQPAAHAVHSKTHTAKAASVRHHSRSAHVKQAGKQDAGKRKASKAQGYSAGF